MQSTVMFKKLKSHSSKEGQFIPLTQTTQTYYIMFIHQCRKQKLHGILLTKSEHLIQGLKNSTKSDALHYPPVVMYLQQEILS